MVLSLYHRPVKERDRGEGWVCVWGGGGGRGDGRGRGIGVPQCEWCVMFVLERWDNLRFGYSHRPTKQE